MQSLRESFGAAFDEDFEILGDSMKVVENGRYWVVAVRPRRSGTFFFRHQFEQNASYRHHDDESRIVVLEKGETRRLRYDLNPQSICVGDTLLAPFAVSEGTSAHRFSNASRFPQYFDGPFESKLEPGGPIDAPVRYLGREALVSVHRVATRASLAFHAYFEAVTPGRCNLSLTAPVPDAVRVVTSIAVVAPNEPVTTLLASVSTHGYDTPNAVSTGWASYPTSVTLLRPGDRISLTYGWMTVANDRGTRAMAEAVQPEIQVQPFAIGSEARCNDWMKDALRLR